jgi:hypothetical protein
MSGINKAASIRHLLFMYDDSNPHFRPLDTRANLFAD